MELSLTSFVTDVPFHLSTVVSSVSASLSRIDDSYLLSYSLLDSDNTYSILLYGSVAIVALYLTFAIVVSLESIPLKENKEMEARIELKQKIYEIFKDFMTGTTKLEELGNAANTFLLRFQQGLSLLQRPPMVTSSKLIENIIKNNETRRLKSYIEAGCVNIHDAAQSTRASQSLLIELEHLTDEAALVIESVTQLDKVSSDELRQVTCDEEKETVHFPQEPEVTEYAAVIAVVYSMVKQNYAMQEKIVRWLSLNSSSGELETYSLMWSLRPFVEDEIMNRAWKWIH